MEAVTVQALTTVAGLAIVTAILVGVVRKAAKLSGEAMDQWGAVLSMGIAVVLAIVASLTLGIAGGTDLFQAILNGIFGGLAASGGFDVLNGARKATS